MKFLQLSDLWVLIVTEILESLFMTKLLNYNIVCRLVPGKCGGCAKHDMNHLIKKNHHWSFVMPTGLKEALAKVEVGMHTRPYLLMLYANVQWKCRLWKWDRSNARVMRYEVVAYDQSLRWIQMHWRHVLAVAVSGRHVLLCVAGGHLCLFRGDGIRQTLL